MFEDMGTDGLLLSDFALSLHLINKPFDIVTR